MMPSAPSAVRQNAQELYLKKLNVRPKSSCRRTSGACASRNKFNAPHTACLGEAAFILDIVFPVGLALLLLDEVKGMLFTSIT